MFFNPVDNILFIMALIFTGLLIVDAIRANTLKATKYRLRGEGVQKIVAYAVLPTMVIATILVVGTVAHRTIINGYLISASSAMLDQNSNKAEQLLGNVKWWADLAVVEQGYTRVATSRLSTLMASNAESKEEIDPAELQAALSNVLSHARAAIEKDPTDPINYMTLGGISEQLISLKIDGAKESAQAAYKQALVRDPLNPSIPFALARLSASNEDKEEFVAYLEQSLRIKPNYVPALYQYGLVKLTAGDKETAAQIFSTIIQLDNNNANALYYMAALLAEGGQTQQALVLMQRVQILNKDNAEVAKLVRALEDKVTEASKEQTATTTELDKTK